MAQGTKTENTAVNRLIDLAGTKPLEDGGFDELFVDSTAKAARTAALRAVAAPPAPTAKPAPPPPFRTAQMNPSAAPPPLPTGRVPSSTQTDLQAAPPVPRRTQHLAAATPPPELVKPRARPPQPDDIPTKPFDTVDEIEIAVAPVEIAPAPLPPPPRPPLPPPMADEESWFEASRGVDRVDDHDNATHDVPRVRRGGQTVWFIGAAFALGLAVAALLFWPGKGAMSAQAPAPAAPAAEQPAPAAAPVVAPIVEEVAPVAAAAPVEVAPLPTEVAPAPAVAPATEITMTFESSPAGATVVLVDNGEMIPLGPAPVEHAVEAGKRYEAMFSLDGHASVIVPVEPALGGRVAATLASVGSPAAPAVAAEVPAAPAVAAEVPAAPAVAAPPVAEAAVATTAPAPAKKARPAAKAKAAAPAKPKAVAAAATSSGEGVLMLAAKPPCDILIDGKKTGLTTPQRSISLAAGKHTITLVNREHGIKEAFAVTVKAGASVKVVKDLTTRMK